MLGTAARLGASLVEQPVMVLTLRRLRHRKDLVSSQVHIVNVFRVLLDFHNKLIVAPRT